MVKTNLTIVAKDVQFIGYLKAINMACKHVWQKH